MIARCEDGMLVQDLWVDVLITAQSLEHQRSVLSDIRPQNFTDSLHFKKPLFLFLLYVKCRATQA